jgi:hypothetical protein
MKLHFTMLLSMLVSLACGADSYSVGDTLFVWAKRGLHIRSEPDAKSKVLNSLAFGDDIVVLEKSAALFESVLLKGRPHEEPELNLEPFRCKGYWVKIKSLAGLIGYVADPYLQKMDPDVLYDAASLDDGMRVLHMDTLSIEPNQTEGLDPLYHTRIHHPYGFYTETCFGCVDDRRTLTFPQLTIEDVLMLSSHETNNYADVTLDINTPELVKITVGEVCYRDIIQNADAVLIREECGF